MADAWEDLIPRVKGICSDRKEFLEKCMVCPLINLCMWCPAHAYLEKKEMDAHVEYFCSVAHKRKEGLAGTLKGAFKI